MRPSDKQISTFLFITQGVGVVFVGIFLGAYLGGLPSTSVLHSEPAFRIPLTVFGLVIFVLILAAVVLAAVLKSSNQRS